MDRGARLFVVDPRRTTSAEWADCGSGSMSGSDIALANAIGREIIARGPRGRRVHRPGDERLRGLSRTVESYTLEYAERETGVPAAAIREPAHAYATATRR